MVFVLLVCMASIGHVWAASLPLILKKNQNQILDNHFQVLIDQSGDLTLKDVQNPDADWTPSSGRDSLHFGYTHNVVWLRVPLKASSSLTTDHNWVLHFQYAYLDHIDLYVVRENSLKTLHSGYVVDPEDRALVDAYPAFPIRLNPGEQVMVYVRAQVDGSMTLDARITSRSEYHAGSEKRLLVQATFIGMVLGLGLYNLFLGLVLKQYAFLFYACFVFVFGFTTETTVGVVSAYLYPLVEPFIAYVVPVGYTLSVALALLFARSFLSLRENIPKVDKLVKIAMTGCFVIAALAVLLPVQVDVKIMSSIGVIMSILLLVVGALGIARGIPAARYFMFAWLGLMVGTALVSVRNIGWLPSTFVTVHGLQLGSFADMLLLSFGLASRFNELRKRQETTQAELVRTLQNQERVLARRVLERTDELENSKHQLEELVVKDALTGAFNRYGLQRMIEHHHAKGSQARNPLGMAVIDLDGFKPVNDQYGHPAGDEVLKVVARRLRSNMREGDIVVRYGGDEFVLICSGYHDREELLQFGQRIRDHISEPIHLSDGRSVVVGASVGLALAESQCIDMAALLQQADNAMYHIKHNEKGGVAISE